MWQLLCAAKAREQLAYAALMCISVIIVLFIYILLTLYSNTSWYICILLFIIKVQTFKCSHKYENNIQWSVVILSYHIWLDYWRSIAGLPYSFTHLCACHNKWSTIYFPITAHLLRLVKYKLPPSLYMILLFILYNYFQIYFTISM